MGNLGEDGAIESFLLKSFLLLEFLLKGSGGDAPLSDKGCINEISSGPGIHQALKKAPN